MKEALFKLYIKVCVRKLKCCTYLDNIECVMIVMSPCSPYILYARRREINEKEYIFFKNVKIDFVKIY